MEINTQNKKILDEDKILSILESTGLGILIIMAKNILNTQI